MARNSAKPTIEQDASPVEAQAKKTLPESVKLAAPYGFIDEVTGEVKHWFAGTVVTDIKQIELLIERLAPLE